MNRAPQPTADIPDCPSEDRHRPPSWRPRLLAAAALLAAVLVRALLPFVETDVMLTHVRLVDALFQGQNWARQALVGEPEFPTLASLGIMAARALALVPGLTAGVLLVAASQVLAVVYFCRTCAGSRRGLGAALVVVAVLLLMPPFRALCLALDPNWVVAVPAMAAVYHLQRWQQRAELRDAVVLAVNAGVLTLGGWTGVVLALSLLCFMTRDLRCVPNLAPADRHGLCWLLWAPFVYGLLLWLIWNRLILGDFLFGARQTWLAFRAVPDGTLLARFGRGLRQVPISTIGGGVALLVLFRTRHGRVAAALFAALLAVVLGRAALHAAEQFAPGGTLLCLLLGASAFGLAVLRLEPKRHGVRVAIAALLLGVTAGASWQWRGTAAVEEGAYMHPAPPVAELTAWIDRFWPESRMMVYGVRAAALYYDPAEKRFVGQLDFRAERFLAQAAEEQLHLLVPPPDGRFYPRAGTLFTDIYENGRPWLLLERRWASGWQLWRCVLPPEGESRLETPQ